MKRRIPFFPTLVVIAAAAVMVALGFWQLGRSVEKTELLVRYETALASDLPAEGSPAAPENAFRRFETYCAGPSMSQPVSGRDAAGRSGWAHVVLCEINGPDPDLPADRRLPDYASESGRVMLGWTRSPEPIQWDGGKVAGTILPNRDGGATIVADPPLAGLQPLAKPDPNEVPNNHLSYAFQWFFFALTALAIYFLALRARDGKRG